MTTHPMFCRASLGVLALSAVLALHHGRAMAQTPGPGPSPGYGDWRSTVLEENDSLYFNSDKHYTQGLRLSLLSPVLTAGGWTDGVFNFLGNVPMVFANGAQAPRRVAWFLGQSIFTPKNLDIKPPSSRDRPYAGWLYVGPSLLQETNGNQLENFEIEAGVIGPGAFGRQVQNDFHQFIGIHQAQGWSNQLQNEPGGVLAYDRLWRFGVPFLHWEEGGVQNGVDIVPQFGGAVGNVFDYAQAGVQLRIGHHLETDYGPVRIRPSISGTDYFDGSHLGDDIGWYIFAGVGGRAVARNVFLDGNTFRTSAHVEHKTFVGDLQAGLSAYWSDRIRADFSVARRTDEFVGQRAPDVIGTAALAWSW
ncbi:MAG TPA: lipid A deacylase LpxR family protein [Stellaceae bacterium]|nr:lipid A deacylase LpxR family protein [Stellaceae bacterium]